MRWEGRRDRALEANFSKHDILSVGEAEVQPAYVACATDWTAGAIDARAS